MSKQPLISETKVVTSYFCKHSSHFTINRTLLLWTPNQEHFVLLNTSSALTLGTVYKPIFRFRSPTGLQGVCDIHHNRVVGNGNRTNLTRTIYTQPVCQNASGIFTRKGYSSKRSVAALPEQRRSEGLVRQRHCSRRHPETRPARNVARVQMDETQTDTDTSDAKAVGNESWRRSVLNKHTEE